MKSLVESARLYAEMGWAVFPLGVRSKTPLSSHHTFKTARSDSTAWSEHPNSNIGIAPKQSGLIILDVDQKNGGYSSLEQIEREHGTITTRYVNTGSGGRHYYFSLIQREDIQGRLGVQPGIDIMYHVNHVVAPPSIHPNGELYRWENPNTPIEPAPLWLLKMAQKPIFQDVTPAGPSQIQSLLIQSGQRGRLSNLTNDFIANGAVPGTWNQRLFKAATDYREQGYTIEEFKQATLKCAPNGLDVKDNKTIESTWKREVRYAPRLDTNASIRAIVESSHLIQSVSDPEKRVFVDKITGKAQPNLNPDVLTQIYAPKVLATYIDTNRVWASFEYNPRQHFPLSINADTNINIYNTYLPPVWREDEFYNGNPPEPVDTLPELYSKFFRHLTDNHTPSFDYLLDWIATSVTDRNWTLLTAIGAEGIGKGTLGQVLHLLHGDTNYVKVRDTVFKKEFNSALKNRTLVHVDEIDLKSKEAIDRMKDVVNQTIEIEQKGVDSFTVPNHASFYLNSNSMDAVKIGPGDRRYSIIELTDKKLTSTDDLQIEALTSPDNIRQLGQYLLEHKVKHNMMIPFRTSQRYEEVKEAGLAEWESWVIETWSPMNRGQIVTLAELQEKIKISLNLKFAPGRMKIMELSKKYNNILKLTLNGPTKQIEVLKDVSK